jgi:anaerobic ribonucleoside-triphosphate reductase activating protein
MTDLQVNRTHYPVRTLGPGVRAGIWTQGCTIGCRGCASQDTWPLRPERSVDVRRLVEWLDSLPAVDGLTITGGEPFQQMEGLTALLRAIRDWAAPRPEALDILVYSGYSRAALGRRSGSTAALSLCDAIITGPYVDRLNPGGLWRGSANQRLVILSELGEARYGQAVAGQPEPRIQMSSDGDRLWLVGIPRRGDLDLLEQALDFRGIKLEETSWNG